MKVLFCLLIATLAIGALATGRPSFEIEHLDWETKTAGGIPYATLASSGDLLIYYDTKDDSYIAVRRRNSEGGYDQVANITRYITPQVRSAHGKWIWTTYALWKIDANNQLTDESFIGPTTGGSMLSDDTFVGYYDGQILTFEYQAEYNNWTILAGTELEVDAPAFSDYDVQSYRAYDNHLVFADASSSILIYQRQADKSWKLNDTITVPNLGSNIGVHFNGVDTVVLIGAKSLSDGSQGIVYIYTKNNNGTWNEQMFNASSLGYIGQTNLGASCAFIDQNTLLVSAGTVNYYNRAPFQIGKVLMMTRTNGGDWTPHIDIIGDDSDVFGMSIAVNDYDFVVHDLAVGGPNPSGRLRVYTAPLCFAQPINVTCKNEQLDDCSSLDNAQLYTVNQSPRCGAITPLLNGASLVDQTLQASFTFTRFETETLSCNATVTCPAPVVPVAPVAVNVPVKAPTAKVSGGSMIQSFGLAVLSLFLAPVLLV